MSSVEGTAENTWVPPEGQHQGLHGPPTSPTPEQLGVWTTGSCLGLRGLALPINKRSPNAQGQGLRLGWGLENHFSSLSATLSRGRNDSSAGRGGAASLGWAEERHPLFSKRPGAAPGSCCWWGGGPTPATAGEAGTVFYWLVQPHRSSSSWDMGEGSFSCIPGGGPKCSLAGAIFCSR